MTPLSVFRIWTYLNTLQSVIIRARNPLGAVASCLHVTIRAQGVSGDNRYDVGGERREENVARFAGY